jgi:osmotically-inducible protein OsmY
VKRQRAPRGTGEEIVARTHCSINAFILACVAAFAIAGVTACENTARGMKQDAAQAEAETRDERAVAADKARELGHDAAKAARELGAAAAEIGDDVADAASGKKEEIDVKAALMADASVDAARIDVDTNYFNRTVTLKGTVKTHTERDMAEVIAKAHADGYKVVNNIQVGQ